MPARIKNCGLKTPEAIDQAIATGASFVGFVHYADSPRHLTIPQIDALIEYARGRIKTVVVTVNPSDELVDSIAQALRPDYLQIHKVNEDRANEIAKRSRIKLIIGIGMRSARDAAIARGMEHKAEYLLLDNPESGSGSTFDWSLIQKVGLSKFWFLAGGLTPANVAEAIRVTRAPMVDVSSGIEDAPGEKSLEKIAAFNKAVLHAAHA